VRFKDLWNSDAERGVLLGLFFSLWWIVVFEILFSPRTLTDLALVNIKFVPYGVLWVLLNPLYSTIIPYRFFLAGFSTVVYLGLWYLVKRGRIPKFLFYLSFANTLWFSATTYPQMISIVSLAPLGAIHPIFSLLGLLQKFPIGWSWNFSDPHFLCAMGSPSINDYCPSISAKLSITGYLLPYYLITMFWVVYPPLVWWKRRRGKGTSEK